MTLFTATLRILIDADSPLEATNKIMVEEYKMTFDIEEITITHVNLEAVQ